VRSGATAEIEEFFADFERASAEEDWAHYGELFLESFLNLDPGTAGPVARDDLVAFLPHRKGVFDRAGATGTRLRTLRVEPLDAAHALARTTWEVIFASERSPVVLETTFVLRREERWRIAVYLNHGSLLELLGSAQS
jgi:hypothetical protein